MSPAFLFLIVTLDLAGVFFGVRMLLSCFKDKAKYPLLEKYRFTVLCQFVYQITILAANTVEAWRLLDFDYEESPCSVISVLQISVNVLLICNFLTMAVIHYHPAVLNLDRTLSPNTVKTTSFAVGFVISAILSWFSCFCQDCSSYAVIQVVLCLLSFAVLMFVVGRTCKHLRHLEHTSSQASPKPFLVRRICYDKKAVFHSACYGITLIILCIYCYQKIEQTAILYREALYLFAMNFVVAIIFPVAFKDLIDSNYDEQSCKQSVSVEGVALTIEG